MTLLVILVFTGTMALSLWATIHVGRVQNKFSLFPASSGSSGAETAERILRQEGICDVEIVEEEEALGDHYDWLRKRLVLSREIYNGTSATALGIAALLLVAALSTGIPEPGSPVPAIAWGTAALISFTGAIVFGLRSAAGATGFRPAGGNRQTAARGNHPRPES